MSELDENFHSREGALNLVYDDHERVQYDNEDPERINKVSEGLTLSVVSLISALGEYKNAISLPEEGDNVTKEDCALIIKSAREDLIEAWAFAQEALSKIGWSIRLDGNEAYAKLINARLDPYKPLNFVGM